VLFANLAFHRADFLTAQSLLQRLVHATGGEILGNRV